MVPGNPQPGLPPESELRQGEDGAGDEGDDGREQAPSKPRFLQVPHDPVAPGSRRVCPSGGARFGCGRRFRCRETGTAVGTRRDGGGKP